MEEKVKNPRFPRGVTLQPSFKGWIEDNGGRGGRGGKPPLPKKEHLAGRPQSKRRHGAYIQKEIWRDEREGYYPCKMGLENFHSIEPFQLTMQCNVTALKVKLTLKNLPTTCHELLWIMIWPPECPIKCCPSSSRIVTSAWMRLSEQEWTEQRPGGVSHGTGRSQRWGEGSWGMSLKHGPQPPLGKCQMGRPQFKGEQEDSTSKTVKI